jgi:hypothetical protein
MTAKLTYVALNQLRIVDTQLFKTTVNISCLNFNTFNFFITFFIRYFVV